jgi:hypothetical protein
MKKYTPEEIQFIRDNIKGRSYAELLELFNRRFGLSITLMQMEGVIKRRKIYNGIDSRFVPGNIPTNKNKKGIHPKSEFKAGHKAFNLMPVGSERMNNGEIEIKIGLTGKKSEKWKPKRYTIWEKANGPVPEGHVIIFADGNKLNLDLDNLLLVSRKELGVMNHLGFHFNDKDLTKIGKNIVHIKMLIKRKLWQKKRNKREE